MHSCKPYFFLRIERLVRYKDRAFFVDEVLAFRTDICAVLEKHYLKHDSCIVLRNSL